MSNHICEVVVPETDTEPRLRITVDWDEFTESPREWGPVGKMCVREHRRYSFPNELGFNFDHLGDNDAYESDNDWNVVTTIEQYEMSKLHWYHVLWLDCYEHGNVYFSISGQGMQCQFDTARGCWFIAVPKAYNDYDFTIWSESKHKDKGKMVEVTYAEAWDIVKSELEVFNAYCNGEIYCVRIEEFVPTFKADGTEASWEWEFVDCFGWIYERDDIIEAVPERARELLSKEF